MSQNNQRPDGFSRPDEWGSWQDEPQQNHGDASGAASHARPAQRDESTASQPEPYRSVDVDPSWAPPSASYQQATPRPVARVKRHSDVPVVTWTLIGICFLVWVGEWLSLRWVRPLCWPHESDSPSRGDSSLRCSGTR